MSRDAYIKTDALANNKMRLHGENLSQVSKKNAEIFGQLDRGELPAVCGLLAG